jgi:DNA-binding response OmpR family regulator
MARCLQTHPTLRTILYSGNSGLDTEIIHKTRADVYLSKPFLPRELISKVHALVAR